MSLLSLAQFIHNSWSSSTTGFLPFNLLISFTPVIDTITQSALPLLQDRKAELEQLWTWAKKAILDVQRPLTLHNECQCEGNKFMPFAPRKKVWLKGTNLHLSHPSAKLAPRCYRPFKVIKVISPVVYWLKVPASWKIFGTFHALLLSPYRKTQEHGANYLEPFPDVIDGQESMKLRTFSTREPMGSEKRSSIW